MRILQLCNVGNICGGTAACAWSITRALPGHDHHIVFRSKPTPETIAAFAPVTVEQAKGPVPISLGADLIIAHNQPRRSIYTIDTPILSYIHSYGTNREPGDHTVYCSRWLASLFKVQDPDPPILYQGVPRPDTTGNEDIEFFGDGPPDDAPTIGRLCTPTNRKWPTEEVLRFYCGLSDEFPQVWWAFVGCPQPMQAALSEACGGKAFFHPAGWFARGWLRVWDYMLYHNPRVPETFGRTCAEAMLAGCFPIVDPLGGFREQVPSSFPWRVERPDFRAFVNTLHRMLNMHEPVRGEWRERMQDGAGYRWGLETFGRNLITAINETTARHAARKQGGVLNSSQ